MKNYSLYGSFTFLFVLINMESGKLSQKELETLPSLESSWHWDHRDTNTVVIGRLPYEMNEMDILIMFSQWGPIANVKLLRDKKTGKSNGTAFLRYERWESTVLCVDNFNNVGPNRGLKIDHCMFRGYRYDDRVENGDANREWDDAVQKLLGKQTIDIEEDVKDVVKSIESNKDISVDDNNDDDDLKDPMATYIKGK